VQALPARFWPVAHREWEFVGRQKAGGARESRLHVPSCQRLQQMGREA